MALPLGMPGRSAAVPMAMEIEAAPVSKEAFVKAWMAKPRLYGRPGTGVCSSFCMNFLGRHPFTACCYNCAAISRQEHEKELDKETAGARKGYQCCSCVIPLLFGLLWFSAFGAIQLYNELDCGSGCEPWVWPNASDAVRADARFNEAYWPEGTQMCSPILGQTAAGPGEGAQNFTLGPAYPKPFPQQWCSGTCDDGGDPLHTPGVLVNVIWGVIFNTNGDHHCKDDDAESLEAGGLITCYYMRRSLYEDSVCDTSRFETFRFSWWWTFIVSELIQTTAQFLMNVLVKCKGEVGYCLIALPLCVLLVPSAFFIMVAAAFSSIFREALFLPYFTALLTEAVLVLAVPVLLMPLFCIHWCKFRRFFPGASNIREFARNPNLFPTGTLQEVDAEGCIEMVGEAIFTGYELFAKASAD